MYEIDMFPSRFYILTDAFKHKVLIKILNTIKKDTDNLVAVSSTTVGQTSKTNFSQAWAHKELFEPIIEQINIWLTEDNISFELRGAAWYAEYGEYDYHMTHAHSEHYITEITNSFLYSGIICLSNFGETSFVNPNSSSFVDGIITIPSEYNKVILFPSNIYHFVVPHELKDKVRAVFSFNCKLTMGA